MDIIGIKINALGALIVFIVECIVMLRCRNWSLIGFTRPFFFAAFSWFWVACFIGWIITLLDGRDKIMPWSYPDSKYTRTTYSNKRKRK